MFELLSITFALITITFLFLIQGLVVRVWAKQDSDSSNPELITVWAVYFNGLVYLGSQPPKEAVLFTNNALIFGMTWGFFTAENSLKSQFVVPPIQESQENSSGKSYSVASMCRLFGLCFTAHNQSFYLVYLVEFIVCREQSTRKEPSQSVSN